MIPLLASLATEVFTPPIVDNYNVSKRWLIEPKWDGHRVIIDYRGDEPKILNRKGQPYSAGPFRIRVASHLRGTVIDGEYLPQERRYHAFDLLYSDEAGDDDLEYARPLAERYTLLAAALDCMPDRIYLVMRHIASSEWIAHYRAYALSGRPIDGVLFKRADSPYTPGRTTDWLKYKFVDEIDCAVTALNIDNKSNCELTLWDPLSEQNFAVGKASTSGKLGVKVGSVVTVRFLKFTGVRLREPRIVRVRDDKTPHECGIDQLIPFVPNLNEVD